jgi:hypothetical protein
MDDDDGCGCKLGEPAQFNVTVTKVVAVEDPLFAVTVKDWVPDNGKEPSTEI